MFVKDMDNSALSPSLSGDLDSTSSGGTVSDSANQSVMSPDSYCGQMLFNPNGRRFSTICIQLRRQADVISGFYLLFIYLADFIC